MELVQSSDALRLTGLSRNQLREWCGRRGIFEPAVPARGSGRFALYSWHDIIALRILLEIFTVFGGRATSWTEGIRSLRRHLDRQFFPTLWGKAAIFYDRNSVLIADMSTASHSQAALVVPLDPHLNTLTKQTDQTILQGDLPLLTSLGPKQ